jgi:drug/metabolite transporter (DMT)-like permease
MTSIPAEFYALVNAFLFALHNMFTKKALRYSNPATAVISGPFFSLILAATFLRDIERVTSRIVLSAAMIVGGVVLLTLWK